MKDSLNFPPTPLNGGHDEGEDDEDQVHHPRDVVEGEDRFREETNRYCEEMAESGREKGIEEDRKVKVKEI